MIRKTLISLKKRKLLKSPAELARPVQGKRLQKSQGADGDTILTIKGQGHPGFFIFFGSFFGGLPVFMIFSILVGNMETDPDGMNEKFTLLFLIPFLVIGAATFLIGLFLWRGQTTVRVAAASVDVDRKLWGKTLQQRQFQRDRLELVFEESHRTNEIPHFKISLNDGSRKIGIGGSLPEEELLWLNRELRTALGAETPEVSDFYEDITRQNLASIDLIEAKDNYKSPRMHVTPTITGWEAKIKTSLGGCLSIGIFGSLFLFVGLMMWKTGRALLFDLFPWFHEAISGMKNTSSAEPPVWFAFIFIGTGLIILFSALSSMVYRLSITLRNQALFIERRWLLISVTNRIETREISYLKVNENGHVNNQPRFQLEAQKNNGQRLKIMRFASKEDVGQLKALLQKALK